MEYCSKKLKIAGIINILLGIITVLPSPLYGIFMLITGFILYTYSNENYEGLTSKKTILVIIALIMLITNIVSAILILLVTDKLEELRHKGFTGPPKRNLKQKIVVIDPEVKRIDILLKLGVGMVFVSGILFATTTWEIITNPIKALVLILYAVQNYCVKAKFQEIFILVCSVLKDADCCTVFTLGTILLMREKLRTML